MFPIQARLHVGHFPTSLGFQPPTPGAGTGAATTLCTLYYVLRHTSKRTRRYASRLPAHQAQLRLAFAFILVLFPEPCQVARRGGPPLPRRSPPANNAPPAHTAPGPARHGRRPAVRPSRRRRPPRRCASGRRSAPGHVCGRECRLAPVVGNAYQCLTSGRLHICDATCDNRVYYDAHSTICRCVAVAGGVPGAQLPTSLSGDDRTSACVHRLSRKVFKGGDSAGGACRQDQPGSLQPQLCCICVLERQHLLQFCRLPSRFNTRNVRD